MKIKKNESALKRLSEYKGFTFVEIMVAIMLLSVLSIGIAGAFGQFSSQQRQLMSRLSTMSLTVNLRRTLMDDSAILNTLFSKKNNVFDCLRDSTLDPLAAAAATLAGCDNQTGTLTSLITSSGQELIDLSDSTAGFTSAGEACTGYGTNPLCNVKVRIDVKFICEQGGAVATGCTKPIIVLTGSLEINEGGNIVNLDNLFEVRKDWAYLNTNLVELSGANAIPNPAAVTAFKLAIIVDNSTSMVSYQQKLSDSLDPLFETLKNSQTQLIVQVYSSSQYLMSKPSNYEFPLPVNSDYQIMKLDSVSCSDGVTTKADYCQEVPMAGIQTEKYIHKAPIERILPANASVAEFAAFKTDILSTVSTMGVSGSDDEQALCTLARLLTGGNGFINTGDKVGVIIISNEQDGSTASKCATEIQRVYSANGPPNRKDVQSCRNETTFDPSTNFGEYKVKLQVGNAGYRIDFRCQQKKDGNFVPYDSANPSTFVSDTAFPNFNAVYAISPSAHSMANYGLDIDKSCAASGISFTGTKNMTYTGDNYVMQTAECPAAVREAISKTWYCLAETDGNGDLVPGKTVPGIVGCRIGCNDLVNYGLFDIDVPSGPVKNFRQTESFNVNYCAAPFKVGAQESKTVFLPDGGSNVSTYKKMEPGAEYTNIANLYTLENIGGKPLWTPFGGVDSGENCCRTNYYYRPFASGIGDVYKSVFEPFGTQNLPMEDAIIERANALLGTDGYFISSIINPSDPAKACALKPDESVGLAFESLIGKVANSAIVPICSADYSAALVPLQQYINTTISSQKDNELVKLAQGEQIVQVYVNDGTTDFQFPVAGVDGVWPTLLENVAGSTDKIYRLDFSKTGYTLAATDRVWVLVSTQKSSLTLGSISKDTLSFDQIRSIYRIGLGH